MMTLYSRRFMVQISIEIEDAARFAPKEEYPEPDRDWTPPPGQTSYDP